MTVCFASWRGYAGCVTSCRHAAGVLGGVAVELDDAEPPAAALDAELLVVSSWSPGYERLLAERTAPTIGRWHSSLLQTELSREGWKLARLLDDERLAAVAANDEETAAALAGRGVLHLPDVFDPREVAGVEPTALAGVNVALPGEAHGRKNLLVQTAAFAGARGDGWTLHLFGQTRKRAGYERWLRLAGVPFVDHGFLPRAEYLSLIAGMDAVLCASLAESFGYAAAEAVELGVPTVVSPAVASVPDAALAAADPSSVDSVARALRRALAEPAVVAGQRAALHAQSAANVASAEAALSLRARA